MNNQDFFKKFPVKKILIWGVLGLAAFLVLGSILLVSLNTARQKISSLNLDSSKLSAPVQSPSMEGIFSERAEYAPDADFILETAQDSGLSERKTIKNASLSLLVKKTDEIAGKIKSLAERLGGFAADVRIYEIVSGAKRGTIIIRVPANRFDDAINDIKQLAIKVDEETANVQDVTEQFIDLEARLKNLRAEEDQYLKIMERAETVEDTLKVASRLSNVRGRIEQIEGQLKYLSRQIDMSAITVFLEEELQVEEVFGIRWRPLFVIKESFHNMLKSAVNYADAVIKLVFRLPIIALWLATVGAILFAAVFYGWKLIRWLKERLSTKKKK